MRMGAGPVGIAEVDGGIKWGICKKEGSGAVGQVDGDFGVTLLEILESGQQPLSAEGGYYRQLDDIGALLTHH
ncbi:hypothetical protein D3C72_1772710 [compost metagenome]